MNWRFSDLSNFYFIITLAFLISCNESPDTGITPESGNNTVKGTMLQLNGKWIEKSDSLHILEFTETELVEYYNHSEINRYRTTIFDGLPGEGGYEDPSGRVIQIEESKDNFHHFTIIILDSKNLELLHRTSGQSKKYNRL